VGGLGFGGGGGWGLRRPRRQSAVAFGGGRPIVRRVYTCDIYFIYGGSNSII